MYKKLFAFLLIVALVVGNIGIISYAESLNIPSIPKEYDIFIENNTYYSSVYYFMDVNNPIEGATYAFSSSDTTILVVEGKTTNAELIGIKEGTAIITCTQSLNGKATVIGKCKVTVKRREPKIPEELDIHIGSVPYYYMSISNKVEGATYTFSSSNSKIVKCSKNIGALTGVKEGTAVITCTQTLNKKTKVIGKCKVTVRGASPELKEKYIYNIGISDFCEISYGNLLAKYTYVSDDPEVLSIDGRGIYTSNSAGEATVTIYETYKGVTRNIGQTKYIVYYDNKEEINSNATNMSQLIEYGYRGKRIELYLDYNYNNSSIGDYESYFWFPVPRTKFKLFWLPSVISFYSSKDGSEYKFSIRDPEICSIEDELYLLPHKEGKTFLYCTIEHNGKIYELGSFPIVVTKNKIKEYQIDTSLREYNAEKATAKITQGHSIDLSKYIYTNLNGSLLSYKSNDSSIISIDSQTGFLTAQKAGKTSIMIGNEDVFCEIEFTVLKKGSMGKLEEDAQEYMKRLDKLMKIQITEENFAEIFSEFSDILLFYNQCKYNYKDLYQKEYFILPNISYCEKLAETLESYYYKLFDTVVNPYRKITEIKVLNNKTLKIKFDKPLTKIDIIDLGYDLYFSYADSTRASLWYNLIIYDKNGSFLNQSYTVDYAVKEGRNEIILVFNENLRKGSYYINWPYYGFEPFAFEKEE